MEDFNESELQNGPDRDQRDAAEDPWCYVTIQRMRDFCVESGLETAGSR